MKTSNNQTFVTNKSSKSTKNSLTSEEKRREELIDVLYDRYARGGTRFAQFRLMARALLKRNLWRGVVNSTFLLKRLLDVFASILLVIFFLPIFLLTSIAIKLEDGGPILYSQIRVGKWGSLFKMYKFRSMVVNAEKQKESLKQENETNGVIFKMRKDPRITYVGRIIRKLSIDESPQFWNVLKGDMSLVGPRPPLLPEVNEYSTSHRQRLSVRPGITCLWQVSGRSEIDFEGQVRLDLQYIQNRSFLGDLWILLKTIPAVLLGKGAY
ncbi:MAG: sugar transferase [Calditrichia bacterium]